MSERAYDPELAPLIPALPTVSDFSDIGGMRKQLDALVAALTASEPVASDVVFEDRRIPGPEGAPDVPVRIYRPEGSDGPRPGVIYLHGGGFMVGSIETEHQGALLACQGADAVVVSVDYRLAPENPFPAGLEDCYCALRWAAQSAREIGIDAGHLGVMGSSAGGGLAAALALLTRDRGGPQLCFQLLGIPELDDRLDTPSMRSFTDTPLWNRANAEISWRAYLGERPGDVSAYAAPARAKDLSGLPPAYVSTMEFDPLRDEGIQYALRLLQHGVSVELHQFPGTFHGSHALQHAAVSKRISRETIEALARGLRR